MSTFGLFGLVIAFAGVAIGSVCLLASQALSAALAAHLRPTRSHGRAPWRIFLRLSPTFCCGLLVFCFMTGDFHRIRAARAF